MASTKEGLSYQYVNGKLIFTTCPKEITRLDLSASVPEGDVIEIEIRFQPTGTAGRRFFAIQELLLPSTLKKFPDFKMPFESINQLVLPESCKELPIGAFYGWKNLESIHLPETLEEISDSLFYDCVSLRSVELPGSICKIGESAFRNCKALSRIAIPEGVQEILENTFSGCKKLTEINFPENLKQIKKNAFKGCKKLLQVDLPTQTTYENNSFCLPTKIFVNGVEQQPPAEEFYIKLSNITLRDVNTKEIYSRLQDGQTVEVHSMIHRFTPRLEVMTLAGEHIGFLAATAVQKSVKLRKIPIGEAFHAKIKFSSSQKLEIAFTENEQHYITPFQEHLNRLNWIRDSLSETALPLNEALYSANLKADAYAFASEYDALTQREEYAKVFSEKEASLVYTENNNWKTAGDEASFFSRHDLSFTLLEHVPLGTEFQVKIDIVYVQVDNFSWGYRHAGGAEDYAYPVPAFVLFYKGIRIANIPLMVDKDKKEEGYQVFCAFWKWSKNPTLQPRAWLIDIIKAEESWMSDTCQICMGFFPGETTLNERLDLKDALDYYGYSEEDKRYLPVTQLMSFFDWAEELNLSESEHSAESSVWLKKANEIKVLSASLYQGDLESYNHTPEETEWYTLKQLEAGAFIKAPQPPEPPYFMLGTGSFTLVFIAAGTHLAERKTLCSTMRSGQLLQLKREPENPYDPNALAIQTQDHQMCGYIAAKQAKWISPLLDAGIISLGKVAVEEVDIWGSNIQLEINVEIQWNEQKYILLRKRGESEIPFVMLVNAPEDADQVFLLEQYKEFSDCWKEYEEFCDALLESVD